MREGEPRHGEREPVMLTQEEIDRLFLASQSETSLSPADERSIMQLVHERLRIGPHDIDERTTDNGEVLLTAYVKGEGGVLQKQTFTFTASDRAVQEWNAHVSQKEKAFQEKEEAEDRRFAAGWPKFLAAVKHLAGEGAFPVEKLSPEVFAFIDEFLFSEPHLWGDELRVDIPSDIDGNPEPIIQVTALRDGSVWSIREHPLDS